MPQQGLKGILLPLLLWLPVTFAIWYFCGALLALLVAGLLDLLLPLLTGERIIQVESVGEIIQAAVVVEAGSYKGVEVPTGHTAELLIETRPMVFAYGMPVFLALAFAADARCDISRNLMGVCIVFLLMVVAFSCGMDLVKTVYLDMPMEIARTSLSRAQADLIALGYQFGVLILPLVVPVLLGCWLCAEWFRCALLTSDEPTMFDEGQS